MLKEIQKEIEIPKEVGFELSGKTLKLTGSKGETTRTFKASGIAFIKKENSLVLKCKTASKKENAIITAISSRVKNIVEGLTKGYEYKLAVAYSHFPMNIVVKEKIVEINNFMGGKKPRIARVMGSSKVNVKGKEIIVSGHDKEEVGQTVANIEQATRRKPTDSRVFQDGIYLTKKGVIGE